ncbi:uncharacterized protein LOC112093322 [Morus notabilis]|uniref:uncharacterized protein LOC112093322 n=1 Tax=Morus notabilis TaxID=981085 RepID=UPI000CED78B8|nr:uncharacterized protein LOC112093322 [Morus notabilis]
MAQTSNNALGVDNTFRRKFDGEEYLERARSAKDSKRPPVQRKPLKHRDYEVDLESRLGKTQVVTLIAPLSQQDLESGKMIGSAELCEGLYLIRAPKIPRRQVQLARSVPIVQPRLIAPLMSRTVAVL